MTWPYDPWFDSEYGDGALEKFRAAAIVEPFDTVTVTEKGGGFVQFEMSGPDEAYGRVGANCGNRQVNWVDMEVRPDQTGTMQRLAASWAPVLAELGFTDMRIAMLNPAFEKIGFNEAGECSVERLVEFSEWKLGDAPEPAWRQE